MSALSVPQIKHRYDRLWRDLQDLAAEFERAAEDGRSLSHQCLRVSGGNPTEDTWRAFAAANTVRDGWDWQEWEVSPDGETLARYFGRKKDLAYFTRLAEKGWGLLMSVRAVVDKGYAPPKGFRLDLPPHGGRSGWVQLLYEMGELCPPPVRLDSGVWCHTGQLNNDRLYAWDNGPGGVPIPLHPTYTALEAGLFRSSAQAIRFWLDPEGDGPPVHLPPDVAALDGPIPPDGFRLSGVTCEGFSALEMRLLESLWKGSAVRFQEAIEHVYGHDADDKDRAFRSLAKRVNTKLVRKNCPAEIHFKNEYVYLYLYPVRGG